MSITDKLNLFPANENNGGFSRRDPRTFPTTVPQRAAPSMNALAGPMTEGTGRLVAHLLEALLHGAGDHPITSIATTMEGAAIGTADKYIPFWKNTLGRVVSLKIVMDPGTNTGAQVAISLGNEGSNQNKIGDIYAGGQLSSSWILVKPEQTIFVNTMNALVDCTGITLRGLLWDPASVFNGI